MNQKSDELAVVIPVYNEEESIAAVLNKWTGELNRLSIDYHIHVYNDGSNDGSESRGPAQLFL